MALVKKVYGVKTPISPRIFAVHGVFDHHLKSRKSLAPQLVIGHLLSFELQLQFVRNQGDELGIGGLSFGVGHRVAEEPLQRIQIAPVPGHLDGVPDRPLHSGRSGLEGLCHLGIQNLCNGVDQIHVVYRDDNGLPQVLVALDMGGNTDLMNDPGNHRLNAGFIGPAGRRIPQALPAPDFLQPLHQRRHIAGLQHQIPNAQIRRC